MDPHEDGLAPASPTPPPDGRADGVTGSVTPASPREGGPPVALPGDSLSPDRARELGLRTPLTVEERLLYHQIHPLKLGVDLAGTVLAAWLFGHHELLIGALVGLVPTVVVSVAMLRWMDFGFERASAMGRYLAFHQSRAADAARFLGQGLVFVGAWVGSPLGTALGLAAIAAGWGWSLPAWLRRA